MFEELVVNELLAGLVDELLDMKLLYNAVDDEVLDEPLVNELLAGLLDELVDMKLLYDVVVDESVDKLLSNILVEVEAINDEYTVVEDEVAAELAEDVLVVQFPRRG
jgi:hypothetical protein